MDTAQDGLQREPVKHLKAIHDTAVTLALMAQVVAKAPISLEHLKAIFIMANDGMSEVEIQGRNVILHGVFNIDVLTHYLAWRDIEPEMEADLEVGHG